MKESHDDSRDRKAKKSTSDSERHRKRNEYLLRWELRREGHKALFLHAVRRYEAEQLQRFARGEIKPANKSINVWKAALRCEPGRHILGWIYQENGEKFIWSLPDDFCVERTADSYRGALSAFIENLKGVDFNDRRRLVTPLEELEKAAPETWPQA